MDKKMKKKKKHEVDDKYISDLSRMTLRNFEWQGLGRIILTE